MQDVSLDCLVGLERPPRKSSNLVGWWIEISSGVPTREHQPPNYSRAIPPGRSRASARAGHRTVFRLSDAGRLGVSFGATQGSWPTSISSGGRCARRKLAVVCCAMAVRAKRDGIVDCIFATVSQTVLVVNLKVRSIVGSTNKWCRLFASLADPVSAR